MEEAAALLCALCEFYDDVERPAVCLVRSTSTMVSYHPMCGKHRDLNTEQPTLPLPGGPSFTDWMEEAHQIALEKGWWEGCGTPEAGIDTELGKNRVPAILLRIHNEVSEAADEYGYQRMEVYWNIPKFESAEVEMVTEAMIRGWAQDAMKEDHRQWSWQQLNHVGLYCKMKPIRDVGAPLEYAEEIIRYLSAKEKPEGFPIEVIDGIIRSGELLYALGYNIEKCMRMKQEFNKTRPYRHGGKII